MQRRKEFVGSVIVIEVIILLILGFHFEYREIDLQNNVSLDPIYPLFQDIHVMVVVGFAFLMTFLKYNGFAGVGMTLFITAVAIQWGIVVGAIVHEAFDNSFHRQEISLKSFIVGDFAAAAVLVSYGAILGRATPTQLLWMTVLEIIFYSVNENLCLVHLEIVDVGGSIVLHLFGAIFGIGMSFAFRDSGTCKSKKQTSYHSDLYAFIGTLVLWVFWPSFNSIADTDLPFSRERAVINTVLSLSGSCVAAFAVSILVSPDEKFDIVHLQNASLAGGIAIGGSANLHVGPALAIVVGMVGGVASVGSYIFVGPFLERRFGIVDTCGVLSLHGIPGIVGAVATAIASSLADEGVYGIYLVQIFPAVKHRAAEAQGGYQIAAVLVTILIGLGSGILTGSLLKSKLVLQRRALYTDNEWFEVPEESKDIQLENFQHVPETPINLLSPQNNIGAYASHL